jgi:large subunit ribosomal protein L9e
MKTINASQRVPIPKGVTVTVKGRIVTVKGDKGTLTRSFRHLQSDIRVSGKFVIVEVWWGNTKHNACVRTVASHIKNMMTGVSKGWMYKIRLVFAHFPISANIKGNKIEVENFLGEEKPRIVTIPEGVTIVRDEKIKEEFHISGISLEEVSQCAARIHQIALVKEKDIRKFLDGIYVSEKGTIGETISVI